MAENTKPVEEDPKTSELDKGLTHGGEQLKPGCESSGDMECRDEEGR